MLNCIKEMIASKDAFLEAADMLFEEGSGTNLDNTIVLGEEAEATDGELEEDAEPEVSEENNGEPETPAESEGDMLDSSIDDDPTTSAPAGPAEDDVVDDVLDQSIDEPAGGVAEEPEPQSPDPTTDTIDDILNTEIDIRSNTMSDTLPMPPAGASDAVAEANDEMDGFLNQRIDSGYGGDSTTESKSYTEAISLDGGGDAGGDTSTDSGSSDPAPDTGSDGGDNSVTSAVKDKVDEIQDDSSSFDGDIDGGEGTGTGNVDKEIMDKVMKASASLEDVKKAFINSKQ